MSSFRIHLLFLCFYASGILLRLLLLNSPTFTKSLGNRVEISTPINAWKRAVEGVYLRKQGIDPYDGDSFHESPLALLFYDHILSYDPTWIPIVFATCDILTVVLLAGAASIYLHDMSKAERKKQAQCPESAQALLLKDDEVKWVPLYVAATYLFCPYSIASCVGKSTTVFQNTLLALFILLTASKRWFVASIALALSSYHSFYHVCLLVPLLMYTHQKCNSGENDVLDVLKLVTIVLTFLATICGLIFLSHEITGSWLFLFSTYGSVLAVPDLTPNIGLFWYFFIEMFEHFRVFFLWTFQLNIFIYTIPLAIRLRQEPMLLLFIHLILIAVFKSYPCIGDVAFYLAMLPIWSHLFQFLKQSFLVGCILVSCTLLAPTLWHLWIYSGSANANFYFATTLAFSTGEIFLLTDLLSAFIKREYYLEKGIKYTDDGKPVLLRLQ